MQQFYISNSVSDTIKIGEELGEALKNGDAVFFTGEMGAGKTHFTKGMAHSLGIKAEIVSPTFALVNEYFGEKTLFHFDLFRINDYDDLYGIGFFDYLDRDGIIAIEWSENVPDLCEEFQDYYKVNIIKTGENSREITIDRHSAKE